MFLYVTPQGIPILTWVGLGYLAGFLALIAFIVPIVHALASWAISNSKRAQARRATELPEVARRRIASLSQRVLEAEDRARVLEAENAEYRRLNAAVRNFNHCQEGRVRFVETGRAAGK
jgi:ABC-type multidrug transport system fused ATPase/permease subunit